MRRVTPWAITAWVAFVWSIVSCGAKPADDVTAESGAIRPRRSNGAACAVRSQCASGFCVDGVCCASACAGVCQACNLSGSLGTCRAAPAGTACGSAGAVCNGAGACE